MDLKDNLLSIYYITFPVFFLTMPFFQIAQPRLFSLSFILGFQLRSQFFFVMQEDMIAAIKKAVQQAVALLSACLDAIDGAFIEGYFDQNNCQPQADTVSAYTGNASLGDSLGHAQCSVQGPEKGLWLWAVFWRYPFVPACLCPS